MSSGGRSHCNPAMRKPELEYSLRSSESKVDTRGTNDKSVQAENNYILLENDSISSSALPRIRTMECLAGTRAVAAFT